MASTGPTNSIDDQAAEWAAETALGELSPESRAELDTWLAADRRHRGAFVRARAWLQATEDAVVGAARPAPAPATLVVLPGQPDRQTRSGVASGFSVRGFRGWSGRALAGGAALAACVAGLAAVGVPLLPPFAQHEQGTAEEVVQLKDGSIVTLRHDARIEVALSDDLRRITLLSGQATFQVARDRSRPFVVRSGDVYAQATGTVYSVERVGPTGGTVKVSEGSVLVWPRDERDQAVLVHAGGMVTLDPGPDLPKAQPPAASPPRLPPPELAQISLDNVPIEAAAVRFNRVNSTKIVIADPAIGDTRIIGLYRANDPEQFAKAAAAITGGRIEHEPGRIVITTK